MNFIVSATTDIGLVKSTNQDSYTVRVCSTACGRVVLAVLCDGMGGLEKGEVASASLVSAFGRWADTRLPALCAAGLTDAAIRADWVALVTEYNEKIKAYAASSGISMGTTLTAMLLTGERYYIINVGDTRAYSLTTSLAQITRDQTVVATEVAQGRLTPEEAERDPRRSVLLQCIGASETVVPDLFFGQTQQGAVYMLCSDGFRHEISAEEIYQSLQPSVMLDAVGMQAQMETLVELNKQRGERDNISVISVRTF